MTFILRKYQTDRIYQPIVDKIEKNMWSTTGLPYVFSKLALATGAGKTSTIVNKNFEHALSIGCDICYTSPNPASIEEVVGDVEYLYPDANIIHVKGFTGAASLPFDREKKNIILCNPTVLSQNISAFKFFEDRNLVIFSDEAHKGFMCSGAHETKEAFGYNISEYHAAWHTCLYNIPHLAWFLISATPLSTTFKGKEYETITEFFDKSILCAEQKAVKSVNFFKSWDFDEETLYENWKKEDEWLKIATKKYNLPKTKPARLIQHHCNYQANWSFNKSDNVAIAITDRKTTKSARNFLCWGNADSVFKYVSNYDNNVNMLNANKLIDDSVNIHNASVIVSYKDRNSIQYDHVTHPVEQLLGRMLRWPKVEGLNNWYDVVYYMLDKIQQGVPVDVMQKWTDLIFKYDVYLKDSYNNRNGVRAFLNRQTYNVDEWEEKMNSWIVECSKDIAQRKKYGDAEKTPHAQKGSQTYKHYKDTHRRCEMPGCNCYDSYVVNGDYEEQDYWEDLEVHHIDGDRNNNDPSNLMTVCGVAHNKLDKELRINNKCLTT